MLLGKTYVDIAYFQVYVKDHKLSLSTYQEFRNENAFRIRPHCRAVCGDPCIHCAGKNDQPLLLERE